MQKNEVYIWISFSRYLPIMELSKTSRKKNAQNWYFGHSMNLSEKKSFPMYSMLSQSGKMEKSFLKSIGISNFLLYIMKQSKIWFWLVILFVVITLIPSIYLQWVYGDTQWMWWIIYWGMPWSSVGFAVWFFASNSISSLLSWFLLSGAYILNASIIYGIWWWVEKLYRKFQS